MLCQALLPTLAYTATSSNPAALAGISKSFGLGQICSVEKSTSPGDGTSQPPLHDHSVHCPLCLAHALAIGLPSAPHLGVPVTATAARIRISTEPSHVPPLVRSGWARAPPLP